MSERRGGWRVYDVGGYLAAMRDRSVSSDALVADAAPFSPENGTLPQIGLIGESELLPFEADEFRMWPNGWRDGSGGDVTLVPRTDPPTGSSAGTPVLRVTTLNTTDTSLLFSPPIAVDMGKNMAFRVLAKRLSGTIAVRAKVIPFQGGSDTGAGAEVELWNGWDPGTGSFAEKAVAFGRGTAKVLPDLTDRIVIVLEPTVGTVGAVALYIVQLLVNERLASDATSGGTHEATYDPGTDRVFVSSFSGGNVGKMKRDGTREATLVTGGGTFDVHQILVTGGFVYSVCFAGRTLQKHNASTGGHVASLTLVSDGFGIASDSTHLYVTANNGHVYKIRLSDFTQVADWDIGFDATSAQATPVIAAGSVWVHSAKDGKVYRINPATGAVEGLNDYATEVLADSPLLYWRLGESSGTTAADASGNSRVGTYGAGVTLGQAGVLERDANTAIDLNNTSSGRVTSAYNPFANGSRRTFEGWANRDTSTSTDVIFGSQGGAGAQVVFRINSGNNDVVFVADDSGAETTWLDAWPGNTRWVHWALTFNEATDTAELFINGRSKGTRTVADPYDATPGDFQIGARFSSGADPFDGKMDEVAVYGSILSAARIFAHYRAGFDSTIPPPDFADVFNYGFGTNGSKLYLSFANGWLVEYDSATNAESNRYNVGVYVNSQIKYDGERYVWMSSGPDARQLIRFDPETGGIVRVPIRNNAGKWVEVVSDEVWSGGLGDVRIQRFQASL